MSPARPGVTNAGLLFRAFCILIRFHKIILRSFSHLDLEEGSGLQDFAQDAAQLWQQLLLPMLQQPNQQQQWLNICQNSNGFFHLDNKTCNQWSVGDDGRRE
jgi:hypothetical protein